MKINNEFTVHAPIDRAWALLTDVEAIAPCMPGAQLTGIRPAEAGETLAGEVYEGKVKVKMGPVVAEYKGTAVFIEKDDEKYRGVIDAKGRDSRGAGNASAMITVQLRPEGDGTTVGIDTDLKISGKIAQFGAGMIQEVSEKLLGQFVGCLEGKLAAAPEPAAAEPNASATSEPATGTTSATGSASEPGTESGTAGIIEGSAGPVPADAVLASTIAPVTAPPEPLSAAAVAAATSPTTAAEPTAAAEPAPAAASAQPTQSVESAPPARAPEATQPAQPVRRTFQPSPEPEALDLLDLAGGAAFKRLLPLVIAGVAAVAAVIYYLSRR